MARKQKRETQEQMDKLKHIEQLKKKMQEICDTGKHDYMSEFTKDWNSKNKDKIQECVKLGTTINFKLAGGITISCYSNKMILG